MTLLGYRSREDGPRRQNLYLPRTKPDAGGDLEHRASYALRLAFAPDGRLWEIEHGPKGGDELNLIEPGKNYGWPLVSYATNYNGVPIPSPDTRPDLTKPVIYWTPVIAPGNLIFYNGAMFPQWKGSALVGGMGSKTLNRITFDGKAGPSLPNAGMLATGSATWKWVPMARCGCSRIPGQAACSASLQRKATEGKHSKAAGPGFLDSAVTY